MEIIFLITGILIGGSAAWLIAKFQFKSETDKSNPQQFEQLIQLNKEVAAKDKELENFKEKLNNQKLELEKLQKENSLHFENLANKIFEEKTKKFTELNKENLQLILQPLGEKIKTFEEKVELKYLKETEGRAMLVQQIKGLAELNKQMSEDASNLTKALRGDTKIQGNWGEFRLEILLEKAGLIKDVHYRTQGTYRDEGGSMKKPDFIIILPDNHHLIIDSKVSLIAYDSYCSAKDENNKEQHLKNHIVNIKNQIKDLGSKNYQKLYEINSPDFVMMFFPIEPAFNLALMHDIEIYNDAMSKNIVLVTPTTLLATMATVASIWKNEDQKKHVIEIARQSGALYDKFVSFIEDLIDVGNRLVSAKKAYDGAMNKLTEGSGNLVKRADDIKKLGAKTSKAIPNNILQRAKTDIEVDNDSVQIQ